VSRQTVAQEPIGSTGGDLTRRRNVRVQRIAYLLLIGVLWSLSGCATLGSARHQYLMRGQIIDVQNGVAYLCIGSSEGAKVGQEYDVYKFKKIPGIGKQDSRYTREKTGQVRVTEIVDEHFARAEIVSGDVKENLFVELGR
jgi:hypothetical protein